MRTLLITAAVLVSTVASAQSQLTLRFANGAETVSVSPGDCASRRIVVTWTSALTNPCEDLSLWLAPGTDCKESASAQGTSQSLDSVSRTTLGTSRTGTIEFDVSELPFSTTGGDGGTVSCGVTGVEQEFRICGATRVPESFSCTSSTPVTKASPGKITYDAKPPSAPTIKSVAQLDQALRVQVEGTTDVNLVRLEVWLGEDRVTSKEQGPGSIQVEDLENDVLYQLRAYAIDAAGNVSETAATAEGTPTKTFGFYEKYRLAGGQETGGCGATGGGLAGGAMLAVLGFWLSSRRNRS
jgi:uncharacterized protein (TIGR03382 family)